METNTVTQNYGVQTDKTRVAKKVLDRNDFLNLMVSQLKNQDPLNPQSNEEFMSTMAQFNSLETLMSLDKHVQYGQAVAMIGKQVTVQQPNKEPVTGKVEKAGVLDGNVVVYVGGTGYKLGEVMETLFQDPALKPATGSDLIQAALMIGREVLIGNGSDQVRGKVEKVGLDNGSIKVFVNGLPYNITGIAEIRDAVQEAAPEGVADGEGTERGTG